MTTGSQDKAFIEAIIPSHILEEAIAWISDKFSPEDVFSESDLITWAEENGYVKDSDV